MSNSILVHTQQIRQFDVLRWSWEDERATVSITRQKRHFKCARCASGRVTATPVGERTVQGLPMGRLPFYVRVTMHRLKCHNCDAYCMEQLDFIPSDHAHITKQLARTIVQLRAHMSISAVARYFQLDWKTVKQAEKQALQKRYKTIRLKDVTAIGIDEIYVGHKKYLTVVRDLVSGRVLHVGEGKGGEALKGFWRKLSHSKCRIEAVAIDMSHAYAAAVREHLPDAMIVFDHFHLIKLMNEKVDSVRRRTMKSLEEEQTKALKKSATCC